MESVEQAARILVVARLLGGAQRLSPAEAAALASLHPCDEHAPVGTGAVPA
jgi:hypothetical protein